MFQALALHSSESADSLCRRANGLYGGQFTFINSFDKNEFLCATSSTTQHHSFLETTPFTKLYLVWLELWQHVAGSSNPQWTQKNIHYTMNMMEWKTVNDVIICTPYPCFHQRRDLRSDGINMDRLKQGVISQGN